MDFNLCCQLTRLLEVLLMADLVAKINVFHCCCMKAYLHVQGGDGIIL